MNTSGFYKLFSDFVAYAPNFVTAPGIELVRGAKDSYTYPVDGWYWFDSKQEAEAFFGIPIQIDGEPDIISPENWDQFNASILSDVPFNQYLGLCLQLAPSIAIALPAVLAQVADKGISSFQLVYGSFCQVASVTQLDKNRWHQFAVQANLRVEFTDLLIA